MLKRTYNTYYRPRTRSAFGGGGPGHGSSTRASKRRKVVLKPRAAQKMARTITLTQQERKKPPVRKLPDGITTVSSFTKGYRLKPYYLPLLKTAAPSYQVIRNGFRVNSVINQFGNAEIYTNDAPFLSQVYTNIVPNSSSANQRAFLEKITLEVEMANSGDQILNLELYEMACVKDTGSSILNLMGNGFSTMQAVGQTLNNNTIGVTPFNSPTLTQMWRVDKVYKVAIPSGHIHKHYMTFSPRMIINETRRSNASYYAGLTRGILLRTRGQPVTQVDNNNVVGVGPSALDLIFIGRSKVKYVAANTQTAWQFGPGTDFGNVITAEAMDPVNDAPDTFTAT